MMMKEFGLVKTAQLVTCQQIEAEHVLQSQPVTVLDNTQDFPPTAMLAKYAQLDGKLTPTEMDASDQDWNVDVLRSSTINKTFGLAKTAQLVTCQQIEAEHVLQSQPVTVLHNTQALLLIATLAIVAQQVQDGSLMLVEMDVTDQERHVDAYQDSMNSHGNARDAQ